MKISTKKTGIGKAYREGGFTAGYNALAHGLVAQVKKDLCEICYWNYGTFLSKLRGRQPFRIYEIQQIEKYFQKYNLDPWTGKELDSVNQNK